MTMAPIHGNRLPRILGAALALSMLSLTAVRAGSPGPAAEPSAGEPLAPDLDAEPAAAQAKESSRAPSSQELAGNSLAQFIVHHATVHYVDTGAVGSLTRWRGGRPESICPVTAGLDPAHNDFITARIRALAAEVGAPVQSDVRCKGNVQVLFTARPEKAMAAVMKSAGESLGVRYLHQIDKQLAFSNTHPIQGWYLTTSGGSAILNSDPGLLGAVDLLPLWPLVIQTGLSGNPGYGGIVWVILVIDTPKVEGYATEAIADYAAMVALSVVQSPDHCDPLPSILDLMSPSCGGRQKPTSITAGDLAFLKALYYRNTGLGPSLSRDDIQANMRQQFNAR